MSDELLPDFAVVLTFLRSGLGWSQSRLAEAAGLPRTRINDYEKGRATLTRERLMQLAAVMGIPRVRVEETIASLTANRAASRPPGIVPDARFAERDTIEALVSRTSRMQADHTRALLNLVIGAADALVDRRLAESQFAGLRTESPDDRRAIVQHSPEHRNWALCEKAALESVRLAPNEPHAARDWAHLAVFIAELVPGEESWRRRLQGWAHHFLANAYRACNDLPAAERAFTTGRRLWDEGAVAADLGLLAEVWLPALEADLRKDQRRFPEAIQRIEEALALDGGGLRVELLLTKANILTLKDDVEGSTAVLLEAESLIDAHRHARLAFGLRFNLVVGLCSLGRTEAAAMYLPVVRLLAEELGGTLDSTRCLWLQGQIAAASGSLDEAIGAFRQVRRVFFDRQLSYDSALASLDLAMCLLRQGKTAEVRVIALEMLCLFDAQGIHQRALAALQIFCNTAKQDSATLALTQRVERYLRRAQLDPELPFEAEGAEAP